MKVRLTIFIFFAFFATAIMAQGVTERDNLFIKNLNSFYQNPEQTIKVANYLFENATSNSEKAKALYLLSKSKLLTGNTAEGIEDLFSAKKLLSDTNAPFISSLVLTTLSEQCRITGMHDIAKSYLKDATYFSKMINSEKEAIISKVFLFHEQAKALKNPNAAIHTLAQADNLILNDSPVLQAIIKNELGATYLLVQNTDSSKVYFKKTIAILHASGIENSALESSSLSGLGKLFLLEEDFNTSLEYFKKALQIPVIESSVKIEILENLSELYKGTDSIALSQKFYTEKVTLNAEKLIEERNIRSVIISHIDAEQQHNLLNDKKNYYKWGLGFAGLFLLILIGYYFYNRKLNQEYKRFQKVIAQVEKDEKLEAPFSIDDTSSKPFKGVVIPEETENSILKRLEEFEASTNFTNSNMNLGLLAKQMKTNSKYISEIIHTHKQKNFNTYINELRVNYIIQLMKTDKAYLNYKVSYLAETSGFSSHSAFTVVFKSITGFTPKQFISFLKKNRKEKSATF